MKKLIFLLCLLVSGFSELTAQQRPVTSTYMFNGLALNPAYAGSLNVLSATFVNRKQWVNVPGSPLTQAFNVHNTFMQNQIGVGLQFTRDVIGAHEEIGVYGSFVYKIKTDLGILSMGMSLGMDDRRADFNKLNILNQDDKHLTGIPSSFSPNFGTGLYFANEHMYVGVSVPYILENNLFIIEGTPTESKEKRYYYATGGFIFNLTPNIKLSPTALLTFQQGNRFTWDLNGTLIFGEVAYLGVSYRNNDAFVFLTQLILNENFRIGYAYDATTSALGNRSKGSHEIMLNYRIKLHNYKKEKGCPVYF